MTDHQLLEAILADIRALRVDFTNLATAAGVNHTTVSSNIATMKADIATLKDDVAEAKKERSSFREKLYQFGMQGALVAYVLFDQKSKWMP